MFDDFGFDKIDVPWSEIPLQTACANPQESDGIIEQGFCEMILDTRIVHESWEEIWEK